MHNLQPFFIREQIIRAVREFFYEKHFHEVIPPVMNSTVPLEPNIYPFKTTWNTRAGETELYFSTSPERGIKKMLARGIGNCFALGHCFRNLEGAGSKHMPEYVMLEWYRENEDYKKIMQDLQELIHFIHRHIKNTSLNLEGKWPIYTMEELFKKYASLEITEIIEDKILFQKAKEKGYSIENTSWNELFDQIFVQEIEQNMPSTPYFIVDFPTRLSPLCRVQKNKPYLADRFEFFMAGMEIANGNNENLDYEKIEKSFQKERDERLEKKLQPQPVDTDFINTVKTMAISGKKYAGIGLGIDRLAMIMAGEENINSLKI